MNQIYTNTNTNTRNCPCLEQSSFISVSSYIIVGTTSFRFSTFISRSRTLPWTSGFYYVQYISPTSQHLLASSVVREMYDRNVRQFNRLRSTTEHLTAADTNIITSYILIQQRRTQRERLCEEVFSVSPFPCPLSLSSTRPRLHLILSCHIHDPVNSLAGSFHSAHTVATMGRRKHAAAHSLLASTRDATSAFPVVSASREMVCGLILRASRSGSVAANARPRCSIDQYSTLGCAARTAVQLLARFRPHPATRSRSVVVALHRYFCCK